MSHPLSAPLSVSILVILDFAPRVVLPCYCQTKLSRHNNTALVTLVQSGAQMP